MSSSSLYGYTGNVVVSSNNITTLYNATSGNVVTANVPDRDFTTLYTKQSDIGPTKNYGNANVEAFLNQGTDGANTVQNIIMTGNITVGSSSYLGNVGNVHITGGNSGFVLTTNGQGDLIWSSPTSGTGGAEYIHFDVSTTSNNQVFTSPNLDAYTSNVEFNVMKNGVNIEPQYYVKTGLYTFQVNLLLNTGDTIDVLASGGGGGTSLPAGNVKDIQFNGGYALAGTDSFTYDEANGLMTVGNIVTSDIQGNVIEANSLVANGITNNGISNLGPVGNVHITGGTSGYFLKTDGTGNLTWVAPAAGGGLAGANTQVQYNNAGAFGASADFTFNSATGNLGLTGNINITDGGVFMEADSGNRDAALVMVEYNTPGSVPPYGGVDIVKFQSRGSNASPVVLNTNDEIFTISTGVWTGNGNTTVSGVTGWKTMAPMDVKFSQAPTASNQIFGSYLRLRTSNAISNTIHNFSFNESGGLTIDGAYDGNDITIHNYASFANATVDFGSNSNVKITGGSTGQVLSTDGAGNLSWVSSGNTANYATFSGTVLTNAQPNITSTGTLTDLTVSGNVIIQRAFEKFTTNATGATGTINYDTITQSILYHSGNATANCVLNLRGNSTVSFNSLVPTNDTMTVVFLNTVGTTAYINTTLQIDGSAQTVKWAGNASPTTGTRSANCKQSYTYTVMKTGSSTYTVLGALTEYV